MTEVFNLANSTNMVPSPEMEVDLDYEIDQEKARINLLHTEIAKLKTKLESEEKLAATQTTEGTAPPAGGQEESQEPYILSSNLLPTSNVLASASSPSDPEESTFAKDHVEDGLVLYSRNFQILLKGGTLEKVIERLTLESAPDNELVDTFLLTYRKYFTAEALLEKIWERYEPYSPQDLEKMNETDRMSAMQAKKIIRLRVANFTKRWLTNHFHDYLDNDNICKLLRTKCEETFLKNECNLGQGLISTLDEQLLNHGEQVARCIMMSKKPPEPIIPKSNLFEDFDPIEIARQLCLFEHKVYSAIHPKECLDQCWNKEGRDENCPHIMELINFFNSISGFVAHTILQYKEFKDRVNIVRKFLRLIVALYEENNFNACQEIMSGLADSSIYRLRRTWIKVEEKDKKLFQQYKEITQKLSPAQNWKAYRANLKLANPPCVPYLGVYLTDLTFIEDGNKNYLTIKSGRTDLINLEKMRMQALLIQDIMLYQQTPYNFEKVPMIYDFFANYGKCGCMPRLTKDDVKKLHPVSVMIETREEVELAKQKEARIAEKEQQKMQKSTKKGKSRSTSTVAKDKRLKK